MSSMQEAAAALDEWAERGGVDGPTPEAIAHWSAEDIEALRSQVAELLQGVAEKMGEG